MADKTPTAPPSVAPKLPGWLRKEERLGRECYRVDPSIAYPMILSALGVDEKDWDQYWIEVAYQCAKMAAIEQVGWGPDLLIDASGDRKERWALAKWPKGRGAAAATRGLEAKAHYEKIRRYVLT